MMNLSPREIEITELRNKGETYESIAKKFYITRERVRQIVNKVRKDTIHDLIELVNEGKVSPNLTKYEMERLLNTNVYNTNENIIYVEISKRSIMVEYKNGEEEEFEL